MNVGNLSNNWSNSFDWITSIPNRILIKLSVPLIDKDFYGQ